MVRHGGKIWEFFMLEGPSCRDASAKPNPKRAPSKTNISEDDSFPFKMVPFQGTLVHFRRGYMAKPSSISLHNSDLPLAFLSLAAFKVRSSYMSEYSIGHLPTNLPGYMAVQGDPPKTPFEGLKEFPSRFPLTTDLRLSDFETHPMI